MKLRAAAPSDLPAIAAIQAAAPEAAQWPPGDYLRYECAVADDEGVAGFIVTRQIAPGEAELLNLAVAPSARRRGIGRALLAHVLEARPGRWLLEVRASNASAIRLYESAGFSDLSRRPGYYRESPEAAIVMVRQK